MVPRLVDAVLQDSRLLSLAVAFVVPLVPALLVEFAYRPRRKAKEVAGYRPPRPSSCAKSEAVKSAIIAAYSYMPKKWNDQVHNRVAAHRREVCEHFPRCEASVHHQTRRQEVTNLSRSNIWVNHGDLE
ncbi:hypothetical protein C8Q70DRAFT_747692 [Cubamyces menziesii]|nr:hypothetical protein C8Q70DRAFT_747692 [Cubamyces menziesii]